MKVRFQGARERSRLDSTKSEGKVQIVGGPRNTPCGNSKAANESVLFHQPESLGLL